MPDPAFRMRMAAWAVHLLTASGAVWGLLALVAIADRDWHAAFVWMVVAMAVDSVDGVLARAVGVGARTPRVDGALLDNTIDYLNYVIVPAFFLARAELLPAGTEIVTPTAVALASAYQFSQIDAKTDDHFFKGFPSFWNVTVLYLFFARLPTSWNLGCVLALVVGVFVPLKWAYPSRMQRWRAAALGLTVLWGLSVMALVWHYPAPPRWLFWTSLAYVPVYALLSLYLSNRA